MKNRLKISVLLAGFAFVGSLFATTSCKQYENYDTQQISGSKTSLNVYGPRPAMRGAKMTFIGAHMDKVTAIEFPVHGDVTDITVVSEREINVIVPEDAGYGKLTLKVPGQDNIVTPTELTYTEPITIEWITTATVKAGDDFQIKGQYLYLATRVIFSGTDAFVDLTEDNLTADENDPSGEQTISVKVPDSAISGSITLSNVVFDENGVEVGVALEVSSGDLVANIIEPVATSFLPATVKAGANLTITGTNLDLVEAIRFGGNKVMEEFTLSGNTITVVVPEDAQDGKIILVSQSGAETESADELVMLLPTVTAIAPNPVRNESTLTITGTDLDLVTKVTFGGGVDGTIQTGETATSVKVTVPVNAKEGVVTLTTASTKTVETAELKLVKPVVTSYASSTVGAGTEMTFIGENLDLVTKVTFLGNETAPEPAEGEEPIDVSADNQTVTIETPTADPTSLTITVPALAQAGDVVLTMVNGDVIECPELTINAPLFAFIPVLPAPDVEILAGEILTVEVVNGDKLTDVQLNGATTQFILKGTELSMLVPADAGGRTELKLVSSNGEVAYTIQVTGTGPIITTIWEGEYDMFTNEWADAVTIANSWFSDAVEGNILRVYHSRVGTNPDKGPEIQYANGDWDGSLAAVIPVPGTAFTDLVLTSAMIERMFNQSLAWAIGNAFNIQGRQCIVTKLELIQE